MNHSSLDSQVNLSSSIVTPFDRAMIQRCLELARCALGKTSPNPLVGSVVVKDGKIVGEGFHPQAGQPHAEVFALRDAGDQAQGATVYVNLEPCNHYGRTPPCSESLIAAQVAKVVIGMSDPHKTASGGIQRLQEAGIEVVVGVEEEACRQLNEAFIHSMLHKRPFGILKYAMTLDGKIATTTGHSAWITGENARRYVHGLRSTCDAVIVGGSTVRHDNPYLTSHDPNRPNPLRVVMSRHLDLPIDSHLWDTKEAPTLILTEKNTNLQLQETLRNQGVEIIELNPLTPAKVMDYLHELRCLSVLWECGGTLAARAISEGVVQKVLAFVAPKIIGGATALTPVGDLDLVNMTQALQLKRVSWNFMNPDLLIEGYLSE